MKCKMLKLIPAVIITCFSLSVKAQSGGPSSKNIPANMKQYYMVFLKKGPTRDQDSATVAVIQEQHLAHLAKLHEAHKICMAGPFMEDGDIRGIAIYNTSTMEEAKSLASEDPAVKAGRLIVEFHPWYAARGSMLE